MASAIMTAAPRALHTPRRDQEEEGGRYSAQQGSEGKDGNAQQQQATAAYQVAELACDSNRDGDRQQIGQHDPLCGLKGGGEAARERGSAAFAML